MWGAQNPNSVSTIVQKQPLKGSQGSKRASSLFQDLSKSLNNKLNFKEKPNPGLLSSHNTPDIRNNLFEFSAKYIKDFKKPLNDNFEEIVKNVEHSSGKLSVFNETFQPMNAKNLYGFEEEGKEEGNVGLKGNRNMNESDTGERKNRKHSSKLLVNNYLLPESPIHTHDRNAPKSEKGLFIKSSMKKKNAVVIMIHIQYHISQIESYQGEAKED